MMIIHKAHLLFHDAIKFTKQKITVSSSIIVLIAIAVIWTNFNNFLWKRNNGVLVPDVIIYYSYLPAAFIYHDLTFGFVDQNIEKLQGKMHLAKTADGKPYQKMTMGLAIMYAPYFLIGHATAWLSGAEMDGYSEPYMFWLQFSSMIYLIFGLILLRLVLKRFFSDRLTAFTLFAIVVGTNLFFYATLEAAMSHSYNFFLFSAFVWLTIRWYENPVFKNSFCIGIVYGFIVLVRPLNGLIVVFFLLFNISQWRHVQFRLKTYLEHWGQIMLIGVFAFLIVLPQLVFWKINTGNWFFYSYGNEGFFFHNPQIIKGLFSYRKGWLLYTPIMVFALAGIYFLRKRIPSMFLPILVFTVANIYVVYSWWDWSYGGSFGSRPMIDSYGLMAISMAALLSAAYKSGKWKFYVLQTVIFLLILFNIFQTLQYKYATIHFAEMSKAAYWHSFGKLSADAEFYDQLEPMDYSQLIQGNYVVKPKLRQTIGPAAINNFEVLSDDQMFYISSDQHYRFLDFKTRSDVRVRNGQFAALLTHEKSFCSGIDFYVNPRQKYRVTVWKFPADAGAAAIMASVTPDEFYLLEEKTVETDAAGWGKITFEAEVPDHVGSMYRVYLWNKSADTVFFDDLKIERIR